MSECILADCFEIMKDMPDGSIDLILTDPPYGAINQKWDVKIDVLYMMNEFFRLAKETAPIVITCQQPFANDLMNAGRKYFRQELIWYKTIPLGFLDANRKHLRAHENIFIFSKKSGTYNPVMVAKARPEYVGGSGTTEHYRTGYTEGRMSSESFPRSVLEFSNGSSDNAGHPTEKPEALFEYLIKTYSNEGDVVFDPFAGSFTTALAALATKRNFICIEKEEKYFDMGSGRIKAWHEFKPYSRKTDKMQIGVLE